MTEKKFAKTLSAPVDEATWSWFRDQADQEYRNAGAHLRWLILKHKDEVENRGKMTEEYARALRDNLKGREIPVASPEPEPLDEGMI